MNKDELIYNPNWFYSLELNQVDLYLAHNKKFNDYYGGTVFERVAQIEQGHVDNIAQLIRGLGGKPTRLGEMISPIIGTSLGTILSLSGLDMVLRINIRIEEKAMKDYSRLIEDIEKGGEPPDGELAKTLKFNYIDEHLHTALFNELIGAEE